MGINIKKEKSERILAQIVTGLVVTAGSAILKEMINAIKSNASIINLGEYNSSYTTVNKIIYEINPELYNKHRLPTNNNALYMLTCDTMFYLKISNKTFMKVETYKEASAENSFGEEFIKLTIYGKNRFTMRKEILRRSLLLNDGDMIRVISPSDGQLSYDIIPHSFDNIIIPNDIKNRIINGLNKWNSDTKWYSDHELVHKKGVLLYGQPGTGKSTIAKAISNMFGNAPIIILDSDNVSYSIEKIIRTRQSYYGILIILIEDFDMYFKSRENEDDDDDDDVGKSKITHIRTAADTAKAADNQNIIFQILDGVYSTDNTIYIATTNHIESIDPALIRPGRFDIREELHYMSREDALKCTEFLGYDEKVLDSLKLTYPVQPVYLQSKIMEYRANT